jgi:hypothetical protein
MDAPTIDLKTKDNSDEPSGVALYNNAGTTSNTFLQPLKKPYWDASLPKHASQKGTCAVPTLDDILSSGRLVRIPFSHSGDEHYVDRVTNSSYFATTEEISADGKKSMSAQTIAATKLLDDIRTVATGLEIGSFTHRFNYAMPLNGERVFYDNAQKRLCYESEAKAIFFGEQPEHRNILVMDERSASLEEFDNVPSYRSRHKNRVRTYRTGKKAMYG